MCTCRILLECDELVLFVKLISYIDRLLMTCSFNIRKKLGYKRARHKRADIVCLLLVKLEVKFFKSGILLLVVKRLLKTKGVTNLSKY